MTVLITEKLREHPSDAVVAKIDGSLIKLYFWRGEWRISTRGTAFAEATIGQSARTFADLFREAMPGLDELAEYLDRSLTYIFEVTSPESRVVKPHAETSATYLAARCNESGWYVDESDRVLSFGEARQARQFSFSTVAECVEMAKALPDLDEGYVVYRDGAPICKIKSPVYVAAHHLFSGPVTDKRIAELLLAGEAPEFLVYFPELAERLAQAHAALQAFLGELDRCYVHEWSVGVESQKDFALRVKDLPFSAVLFQARANGVLPSKAFHGSKDSLKLELTIAAMGAADIPVAA